MLLQYRARSLTDAALKCRVCKSYLSRCSCLSIASPAIFIWAKCHVRNSRLLIWREPTQPGPARATLSCSKLSLCPVISSRAVLFSEFDSCATASAICHRYSLEDGRPSLARPPTYVPPSSSMVISPTSPHRQVATISWMELGHSQHAA